MATVYGDVWIRGGVATTAELRSIGHSARAIARAVGRGEIHRARRGHLVVAELHDLEILAVSVGGRLTGTAGARRHGIWAPHHGIVDVSVDAHARGLRIPEHPPLRVDWSSAVQPGTRSLVGPVGCLIRMAAVEEPRMLFAAAESALHLRIVSSAEWARALECLPRAIRRALKAADGLSESGGESLAKFGMLRASIPVRQQVVIDGVGRVDFVVGRRLVVEIDGAEFHATPAAFERDRRRDALLGALGYRVLRFSYFQVLERWPEVERALRAAVVRGDHR